MTQRKDLTAAGYTVTVERTGAEFPDCAVEFGIGWSFVLRKAGSKLGEFADHNEAWARAGELEEAAVA